MSDDVKLGIKIVYDGQQATASISGTKQQVEALTNELKRVTKPAEEAGNALSGIKEKGVQQIAQVTGASRELVETVATRLGPALGGLAVTVGAVGLAYVQGAKEAREMARALDLTGNMAGQSATSMHALAVNMATATVSVGETKRLLTELAGSGQIGAAAFNHVADAAVAYAAATGKSIEEVTPHITKLFTDPAKGAEELNSKMHFLDVATTEHIASMQRQGDVTGAQIELSRALEARMTEIVPKLGLVETAWKAIQSAGAKAWDAMMGIGREPATAALLEAARAKEKAMSGYEGYFKTPAADAARLAAHQEVLRLEQKLDEEATKVWSAGEQAKQNQREHSAQALAATYSKTAQIQVLEDQKVLAQSIINETKRFETIKAIEEMIANIRNGRRGKKAAAEESDFYDQSIHLAKQAEKELADLDKARQKALEDETKSRESALKAGEAYLSQSDAKASAMEKEVENYGKLQSAIELTVVAEMKEARALAAANGAWPEHLAFLDREIAARERIAGAAGQKEVLDANKKAAEDSARTWEKISGDIGKNLTDSIFGGGKSAGEMLKDWFKTLVLAPMVSMATQPISNAVGSALGFNTAGAGGVGGVGNMLSGANSAYNLYTGSTGATVGNAVSWFGNATGSTATSAFGSGLGAASGGADISAAIAAYQEATITAAGAGDAAAAAAYSEAAAGLAEGAGAATAIPYIGWAIAAIALIASLSGKGGGPKTEGDALYTLTGGTPAYAGSEGFFTGNSGDGFAQQITGATAAATTDMLKALGGSGSGVGVRLGFNADPQGSAPDNITGNVTRADGSYAYLHTYDAGRGDYASALQLEAKRVMLAAIGASDVNAAYKSIVNSVDLMTASAEQLDQAMTDVNNVHAILQFGTADPFAAYADSLESAGNSYLAQLDKQRAAVTAAASAYNGSTASITTLMNATNQRYQLEIALAKQLDDAIKASSAMFSDSRRDVQLSGLDAAGRYNYYDQEAARYKDTLASLTDPQLIQDYANKLNTSIMAAWGTLDESQQVANKQKYLGLLDSADQLAQDRYAAVKDQVKTDNQQMQADIAAAIDKAMSAAADKIAAAASIPQTVNVVSSFNLSGLFSGAEVGGWEAAGG